MIHEIDKQLKEAGYQYLKAVPEEIGVYYRYAQDNVRVILGIHAHDSFCLEEAQLQLLLERLRDVFMYPKGKAHGKCKQEMEVLTLLVTQNSESYKQLCTSWQGVWICDLRVNRLLIYENQPGDFYGLNAMLLQLLEDRKRQTATKAEYSCPKKTFMELRRLPVVSTILVAINLLVFVLLSVQGDTNDAVFMLEHGAMYPDAILFNGEWYRLFTCMFLHFGIGHLMNNMLMLFCAGKYLEHALGAIRYLILYVLSGIGSSCLSFIMMLREEEVAVSAGASGAIFGIIGALLWVAIRNKGQFENLTTKGLLAMIALCLYYGFASTDVDNWGHIGGLVCGFVVAMLTVRSVRSNT